MNTPDGGHGHDRELRVAYNALREEHRRLVDQLQTETTNLRDQLNTLCEERLQMLDQIRLLKAQEPRIQPPDPLQLAELRARLDETANARDREAIRCATVEGELAAAKDQASLRIARAEKTAATLTDQMLSVGNRLESTSAELRDALAREDALKASLKELHGVVTQLHGDREQLAAVVVSKDGEVAAAKQATTVSKEYVEKLQAANLKQQEQLFDAIRERDAAQNAQLEFEQEVGRLQREHEDLMQQNTTNGEVQQELAVAQARILALTAELETAKRLMMDRRNEELANTPGRQKQKKSVTFSSPNPAVAQLARAGESSPGFSPIVTGPGGEAVSALPRDEEMHQLRTQLAEERRRRLELETANVQLQAANMDLSILVQFEARETSHARENSRNHDR